MPKKENVRPVWKAAAWSALCTLGVDLTLQFLNALLVARETIGEAYAPVLVWGSAGVAALIGVWAMGRGCQSGRMLLSAGAVAGLVLVGLLGLLASGGEFPAAGRQLAGIGAASLTGGTLAALTAGPKRGKRRRRERRK